MFAVGNGDADPFMLTITSASDFLLGAAFGVFVAFVSFGGLIFSKTRTPKAKKP